eukprot:gnl/MRDRNA2_/MRDRNA2_74176_c0_seq2.p1 gnl/MRDRNA2_/MRDRNA2_74176_c0~~gnl/MRDRNA2_/MRDRNA2_74176_c0_seq2.p1  ORF type:complete len:390 (+),score=50.53 gnl/MRDRNA2_/MRDRNA2_74176_c0_seq2:74-1243(+)
MGRDRSSSQTPSVLDSLVYGFRGISHLSQRSLEKKFLEVQATVEHVNKSSQVIHLVGSPELALSVCHFLGMTSSKNWACVSKLSAEVVSTIMLHLQRLLPPRICVVGGRLGMKVHDAIEAFNPATSSWEVLKPMQSGRNGCGAVVYHGQLYIVGGRNAQGRISSDVQRYDLAKDEWVDLPNLQIGREKFACAQIKGGIYVAGGWGGAAGNLSQAEYFDPNSGEWTCLPPLPQARYSCGGVAFNGCLYVIGGLGDSDQALNNVDVYDPQSRVWASLPPMPTPRFDCAVAVVGGQLIVIGGRDSSRHISDVVECFDPVTGTWRSLPPLLTPRFGCCASAAGTKLYVIGGWCCDAVSSVDALDFSNERLEWDTTTTSIPTARGGCAVAMLRQ